MSLFVVAMLVLPGRSPAAVHATVLRGTVGPAGLYRFRCDPHRTIMHGSFTVS